MQSNKKIVDTDENLKDCMEEQINSLHRTGFDKQKT